MPKRLLRYALSRLELLDSDALDMDNLDLAIGRNTVFEFRDVGVQLDVSLLILCWRTVRPLDTMGKRLTSTLETGEAAEAARDVCDTESQGFTAPSYNTDGLLHEPHIYRS